jgi:hypothetical protein
MRRRTAVLFLEKKLSSLLKILSTCNANNRTHLSIPTEDFPASSSAPKKVQL